MNKEIQNQINQTENLIQNTKATLKSWANKIGEYHKTLKELTSQLATLKNQLNTNMKNNNNSTNPKGGKN